MTTSFGVNAFYKSVSLRMRCCEIRKVDPLDSVLLGLDAWITGIRRDHTTSRGSAQRIEVDEGHGGIIKVNPPGRLDRGRRLGVREARRPPIQPALRRGIHQHRVRSLYPRHYPWRRLQSRSMVVGAWCPQGVRHPPRPRLEVSRRRLIPVNNDVRQSAGRPIVNGVSPAVKPAYPFMKLTGVRSVRTPTHITVRW